MRETERDLADCVGAVHEAATNGGDWRDLGERACRLLGAQRATLLLGGGPLGPRNVLMPVRAVDGDTDGIGTRFHPPAR